MHFSFGISMAVLAVGLSIYERYVEMKILVEYWECGHKAWFGLTTACILLPTVIGSVPFTNWAIKKRRCWDFKMLVAFLVFPIFTLLW